MATLTAPHAAGRGSEPALVDEQGSTTWAELDARINRWVHGLRARGLEAGHTIAIVVGNRREWFEAAHACAHGGWVYVPVNWHWVADELAYVFADANVRAVVADERYADEVAAALADERATGVHTVVGVGAGATAPLGDDERFVALEDLLAGAPDHEPEDQRLGGPMFYTSGTTGRPKGVRGSLTGNAEVGPEIMQLVAAGFGSMVPSPGVTALCGPAYHSAQWAFSFLPMINGSSIVMQHRYDSAGLLELIDRHAVTNVHLVPTQMKRLVDLPDAVRSAFDGSSLVTVWHGAAPCPPAVKRSLVDWWGPRIVEYYGSTEGAIISTITSEEWLERGGSVGRPVDMVEVLVVDDATGERLGPGQEGTLYFRNKMGTDFAYHGDEEKTRAAHLEPGVFTTGDVGYLDHDGYLWLSDRRIDMIISGGVNIYPAEIEGMLAGHADVADVAVIGIPDDEFGERVLAVVQPADGVTPDDALSARLLVHCRQHLAGYKAPKQVAYVDEIPRTSTGKITKRALREPYWRDQERRI